LTAFLRASERPRAAAGAEDSRIRGPGKRAARDSRGRPDPGVPYDARVPEDTMADANQTETLIAAFRTDHDRVKAEVQKAVVGHENIIDGVLTCLFAGGHCLLEGVPGLGKTLLIRSLSQALHLKFGRIQFTPDLMPADVTGTTIVVETPQGRDFQFRKGPLFAQIVLADEINRATPKTQSALLEAMQEQSVTVAKTTYKLEQPFFVLATQNPLEMEGTYPLPEAQLDRFLFKLHVRFPGREELHTILDRTTGADDAELKPVIARDRILALRALAREVAVARHVQDFAVRVLLATHPDGEGATAMVKRYVRFGASPRGAQAVLLAAKIRALMDGRYAASVDDVKASALPAMRHRMILNFEGEAEGVRTDAVIEEVLGSIKPTGA
jgi:MoxR-like ATPase